MKIYATERGFQVGPVTGDEFDQIRKLAGSAHLASVGGEAFASIASNVHSLVRLKRFYPRLDFADEHTTAVALMLKERLLAWRALNERGHLAKLGTNFVPDGYVYKREPYGHQVLIANFLHAMDGQCAIFGDPGVGKTAAAAFWLDQLLFAGKIQPGQAVVFTKPSIIDSGWLDDISSFTNLRALSIRDVEGEEDADMLKVRRAAIKKKDWDVLVVGYELAKRGKQVPGKKTMGKAMPLRNILVALAPKCVIFDESTELKNHRSLNFRVARDVSASATLGRVPMTGTPAPNGPDDLWSQMYIVDRGLSLEPAITDFRPLYYNEQKLWVKDRRGERVTKYVVRDGSLEEINARIAPRALRVKLADCLDLPETTDVVRDVEMSPEQKRVYREMKEELVTQIEERQATAFHAVVQIMKLRQITSGFLIPDKENGETAPVLIKGPNPKLLELDELLAEITTNNKALVFLQFRHEFELMLERYKKYRPDAIYGATPKSKVGDIVRDFQKSDRCRVLFLHPDAAGYGLTLTAANYCVYYSLSYNSEEHVQSRSRIIRPGQQKAMFFYYLLCKKSIDRVIFRALGQKRDVENLLINGSVRELLDTA